MAEENGVGRSEINGRFASNDSMELRWVFQDDDDNDDDDSVMDDDNGNDNSRQRHGGGLESDEEDEEDTGEQRLFRTGPLIDSFDVEALEIPSAHRNDNYYEVETIIIVVVAVIEFGL
jgi:hypothetical protein